AHVVEADATGAVGDRDRRPCRRGRRRLDDVGAARGDERRCQAERPPHQSSFCATVLESAPMTSVTCATGWSPSSLGIALTARKPLLTAIAATTAARSVCFALLMAAFCACASLRSSPPVMASVLATFPDLWSTTSSENLSPLAM